MTLQQITNENINQFLDKTEIIQETIDQITKDFGLFGIELNLPKANLDAYRDLLDELSSNISSMVHNEHSRLMSVLYQVDITEQHIRKGERELPNYSLVEVIAHQIIARDLQKVLSRRYYK